jgi:PAS domain S-box-containing protein
MDVKKEISKLSLKIVLTYVVYGLSWIFFSDKLVFILTKNSHFLTIFQTTKGFLFVGISALILLGFLLQTFARIFETESKIKESETKWRSLVQNAPDIVIMTDASGKITYINQNVDGILKETVIGKKLSELLPQEFGKLYQDNFRRVTETGEIGSFEIEIDSASKRKLWLEIKMAPVKEGGEVKEVISFARDVTDQKNALKASKESEDRFQKIFGYSNDAIILMNPLDEKIVDANSKACNMFEYSKQELLTKSFNEFHKNNEAQCRDFIGKILHHESTGTVELTCSTKTGKSLDVEISASSIDVDGQIYLIFLIRDISARKKTEQEIALFAHAVKSISDCVVISDMENNILFVNDAFQKTYGYAGKELIGKSATMLHSDTNSPELLEKILSAAIKNGVWQGELLDRNSNGLDFPVFLSASMIFDEEGIAQALIWVSKDITKRKGAEKALRESEAKYRSLFEESNDVVFISTPDGKILDINPAGVELFGYDSKEELLKVKIERDLYWNQEDREKYKDVLTRQGFVKDFELQIKRKDGQRLVVLETARPVHDDNGKIVKFRGILRDITEKKRLEEQLRQAQKLQSLGTLAGGIAHDFNNILGIILGYASMLESGQVESSKLRWNANAITKAVKRGGALVQQILTFAKKKDILFETVKVNATVNELVRLARETFPKTTGFSLDLEEKLPYIKADHSQIHQALLNLYVNARDAMPGGGVISIKTATISGIKLQNKFPAANYQNYVLISLSDQGVGMDKETLSRIFEPFFTTKKHGKGTGLGLAVVYGVVTSHNGFVDVQSEQDVGTTFQLYFPAAETIPDSETSSASPQTTIKGEQETILFVEDEELLRELIGDYLKNNGYRVLTADDGEMAVEVFAENVDAIDLVITDLGLPKLDGWKAYQKMRQYNPHLKMILASGYLDPEISSELTENGERLFVQKPYDLKDMLKKVRKIIEASSN